MKKEDRLVLIDLSDVEKDFSEKLLLWYHDHARDLPWRRTRDPYRIWVSEVMLQQTTVNAVIPYYERWIRLFPTLEDVARAPLHRILKAWQGLGYYHRARNLHSTARVIRQRFQSRIPQDETSLRELPGFGPYTTAAVLSIAFGQRLSLIDANVRRFLMRYLGLTGKVSLSHDRAILLFLDKVMPQKEMSYFNQALMETGALVCRAQSPRCALCVFHSRCMAYEKGVQELIPEKATKVLTKVSAVIAVIRRDAEFLVQKRPSSGLWPGLWEFPGGKVEKNETVPQALKREVFEETGVRIRNAVEWMDFKHYYTVYEVRLHVFRADLQDRPVLRKNQKWVLLKDLKSYPMPSGSARIVAALDVSSVPRSYSVSRS